MSMGSVDMVEEIVPYFRNGSDRFSTIFHAAGCVAAV